MTRAGRAVCIIGAARQTWRQVPAPEPLAMWEAVARAAADDAGSPASLQQLQGLHVVYCQAWEYDDPCGRLASRLGSTPPDSHYSGMGGSVPVRTLGHIGEQMVNGELDLALIVGGEALATRRKIPDLPWSHAANSPGGFPIELAKAELANGIYQAYLTFALLDNARRTALGRSAPEHLAELGRILAQMTGVAAAQPEHAWFPRARSAPEIVNPSETNRMVATPYTKLMTAIMDVDMAAAVLISTADCADRLGVDVDKRVYLHGSGQADDGPVMASRPELGRSQALEWSARSALGPRGADEVEFLDLYSCFGASLGFALDALGLGPGRDLTVTGGLPYHGGPGSNYSTHALVAMTEALRASPSAFGLVTGVGMHMTHHSAALLSASPAVLVPTKGVFNREPGLKVCQDYEGPATVATASTVYSREGPEWTALICDIPGGGRTYARLEEPPGQDTDLAGAHLTLTAGNRGATIAHL